MICDALWCKGSLTEWIRSAGQSDIFNFANNQELSNSKPHLLKEFIFNNSSIYGRGKKLLVLNLGNIYLPVILVARGEISAVADAAEASVVRNFRHPFDKLDTFV